MSVTSNAIVIQLLQTVSDFLSEDNTTEAAAGLLSFADALGISDFASNASAATGVGSYQIVPLRLTWQSLLDAANITSMTVDPNAVPEGDGGNDSDPPLQVQLNPSLTNVSLPFSYALASDLYSAIINGSLLVDTTATTSSFNSNPIAILL
jgi:hypothetical protein